MTDRIRVMQAEDLDLVREWRNHPQVRRFMFSQHEISAEEHARWYERSSQNPRKRLLIFESNGTPSGFVQFSQPGEAPIACWGFYSAPGSAEGTGGRLGRSALNYAFSECYLHKVCGQAIDFNDRSIRFHKGLGFSLEGRLREQHYDGNSFHDVLCFGLLKDEWQNMFRRS